MGQLRANLGFPVNSVAVFTNLFLWELADTTTDASKILTVPANWQYQLLGLAVKVGTTATVGNRTLEVEIRDDNDDVYWADFVGADITQAASLTYWFQFWPGLTSDATIVGGTQSYAHRSLPPTLILGESHDIFVRDTATIDANDDTVRILAWVNALNVKALEL